jgi:Tol biopolymer transport system component
MECGENNHDCIYVTSTDGIADPIQLTPSQLSCHNPQWSPDSTEIIFNCYTQSYYSDEAGIYKAKTDGTAFEMIANVHRAWTPQWSPDGNKIAFISFDDGDLGKMIGWEAGYTSAVYIMNPDGTEITRLSLRNDEAVFWFTWLPFSP